MTENFYKKIVELRNIEQELTKLGKDTIMEMIDKYPESFSNIEELADNGHITSNTIECYNSFIGEYYSFNIDKVEKNQRGVIYLVDVEDNSIDLTTITHHQTIIDAVIVLHDVIDHRNKK